MLTIDQQESINEMREVLKAESVESDVNDVIDFIAGNVLYIDISWIFESFPAVESCMKDMQTSMRWANGTNFENCSDSMKDECVKNFSTKIELLCILLKSIYGNILDAALQRRLRTMLGSMIRQFVFRKDFW